MTAWSNNDILNITFTYVFISGCTADPGEQPTVEISVPTDVDAAPYIYWPATVCRDTALSRRNQYVLLFQALSATRAGRRSPDSHAYAFFHHHAM
jgi:hypothetical protein